MECSLSEFVNVNAITNSEASFERISSSLRYNPNIERPIVAQVFGSDPKIFYAATKKIIELGFDGFVPLSFCLPLFLRPFFCV